MTPWMRKGRRLEYFIGGWAVVCYVVGGFILNMRAPAGIHVFVWLYLAGFVFPFSFVALLIGRWIRRSSKSPGRPAGMLKARPVEARLLLYMLAAVVIIPADRICAKATGWSFSHILLADSAFLILLIAITEMKKRRKRMAA